MTSVEGNRNPTHEIYAGEWWSEKGNPRYEVKVVETTPHSVTYEYPDGARYTDAVPEFKANFTQDPQPDSAFDFTGGGL